VIIFHSGDGSHHAQPENFGLPVMFSFWHHTNRKTRRGNKRFRKYAAARREQAGIPPPQEWQDFGDELFSKMQKPNP
jgi:hypothetical protein